MNTKTHWLQTPNKNYLGHFDLPNGQDVILTIKSAGWEIVENPILNTKESKRVIRFIEKDKWIKPFICNETNAKMICKVTKENYMEDCLNKKIKIGISKTRVKREEVDCLRVKTLSQSDLTSGKINKDKLKKMQDLILAAGKTTIDICKCYNISSLADFPPGKYDKAIERLNQLTTKITTK
jgi:hypothetical protein